MSLEWVNRRAFNEGFPLGLFGILWLLPVVFMMILLPIMRNVRVGNSIMANPLTLLLKIILLILIAWLWITTILDQMPCFVGIPNCD